MTVEEVTSTEVQSGPPSAVCPHFHAAIELIGKRWTGAIICALTERPMRFREVARTVPGLSDRLLSQRLRELEEEGLVQREVEAGTPVAEVVRKSGISEQTFYRWKKQYAGLGVAELRRLKQMEEENRRLKQMVADEEDKHA